MAGYPKWVVTGFVEGLFHETNVALPKGRTAKAYVCRFCDTHFIADRREQIPPHDCRGDGEPAPGEER